LECYGNDGGDEEMKDAAAYLFELVSALDNSFISTWQSTAGWQKQLDAAREYLENLNK
jgi:hypothetical protein